jgi:uncharacterized protein (TIGR02421 family)
MDLYEIDRRISEIAREINTYSLLSPINCEEQRKNFFENFKKGRSYNPIFDYRSRDLKDKRKALEGIYANIKTDDDIYRLFLKKLDFIKAQIALLESDESCFGDISSKLYGRPDRECLELSNKILSQSKNEKDIFTEETVSPENIVSILKNVLKSQEIKWECVLSDKIVPKVSVSGRDRTIYINPNINCTVEEIERLKVHEIEVHIYRGANGDIQPFRIFREGLAGYDETEEGLALMLEDMSGSTNIDRRQRKIYAGRAVSVDYCMRGTFYETFMNLREFFPDYLAYRLAERGKRGLRDTSQKGGLTKGFHYISGWIKAQRYIKEGGDLKTLYVGKIGLEDVDVVKGLLSGGILKPAKYLPKSYEKNIRIFKK